MLWMLLELAMAMEAVFYLLSVLCLISGNLIYEWNCWTYGIYSRYKGPMQTSNIYDIMECLNKCREYDSCQVVTIDYDGKCWYQVNSSDVVTREDLHGEDRSISYIYDRTCEELTSGVDLNCWDVRSRTYVRDLTQIDQKTLAECLNECKIRTNCRTFNWIVDTTPSCWIHTNDNPLVSFDSLSSTNFLKSSICFRYNAGIDLRFWRVTPDTKYPSTDLLRVDKLDLQSCLNYCQSNEKCTMIDFDRSTNPPCWAQTTKFPIVRSKLFWSKTTYNYLFLRNEYEASRAAVRGKGCWKVNGSNPTGLTSDEMRKLIRCRRTCLQRSECDTVSWHTYNSRCYVRSWPLLQPFFILDRECYKSVVGSVGGYKGGVDTTCWIVTAGYNVEGLTGVYKQSLSECLEECLINEDCRAVDWDRASDTKCFIQTNKDLEVSGANLREKSTVINHILDRECFAALFMVRNT